MSSRDDQREQARAQRIAQEEAAAAAQTRKQRLWLLGGVAAVAAIVVVALVLISSGGGSDEENAGTGGEVAGAADVNAMLQGVPQQGQAMGDPKAPVTLVEFADLQCPFCKEFADSAIPRLVQDYVRAGKLRIEFQPLAFINPVANSERAARYAIASGEQNKLWNFVELFFRNQGEEGTDYATDEFVREIADAAGVDTVKADETAASAAATAALARAQALAERNGINATPSFLIGKTGGKLARFEAGSLEADEFAKRIDQELE